MLCRRGQEGPQSPLLLELAPHAATESGGETAGTQIAGSVLRLTADRRVVLCGYGVSTASRNRQSVRVSSGDSG